MTNSRRLKKAPAALHAYTLEGLAAAYAVDITEEDEAAGIIVEGSDICRDMSGAECLETLHDFTPFQVRQLLRGEYLHDGGQWGMVPHKATLYRLPDGFHILTLEVL